MKNIESRVEELVSFVKDETLYAYEAVDKIMESADEYAIGFAEWVDINYFVYNTWDKSKSIKELLEIFKKEKGL